MLVLGSKTQTVEGVTVFADHADPRQFWYLPPTVSLAVRDGIPQFTLIRYRPAVADAGVQGGGFLMMEVELGLGPGVEQKILGAVSRFSDGAPRLSPVQFDDGTVQVVALNVQGGGGTSAPTPPAGAFLAVESILGSSRPSLAGSNTAVFSLKLSQDGATILDQCFKQGAAPVGVVYSLKYTALRPALDVKITANFKRIYDRLSFGVDLSAGFPVYGVPVYIEAGIDMAFEKLKQEGVISIQVINFSTSADEDEKEKWALDFFKQNLLQQWFQPTLAPVTFDQKPGGSAAGAGGGAAKPAGGNAAGGGGAAGAGGGAGGAGAAGSSSGASAGSGAAGGAGSAGAGSAGAGSAGAGSAGAGSAGGAGAGGGAAGGAAGAGKPATGAGGAAGGGGAAGAGGGGEKPEAVSAPLVTREVWAYPFHETSQLPARLDRRVEPETPGYDIQMSQQADGDQVTLMFLGGTDAPTVLIDGTQQDLDGRQLTLTVAAAAAPHAIEATYPAAAGDPEEFRLYFDFDKPRAAGWSASPPSPVYNGYLSNRTNPVDTRYQLSTGPVDEPAGTPVGAEGLRAWLRSSVGSPRRVTVAAHASYEGDDSTASLNQDLTRRRADVSVGVIGGDAEVTSVDALGFTVARTANRVGDPGDRYALVRGLAAAGHTVSIRGTVSRDAAPQGNGDSGNASGTGAAANTGAGTGNAGAGAGGSGGDKPGGANAGGANANAGGANAGGANVNAGGANAGGSKPGGANAGGANAGGANAGGGKSGGGGGASPIPQSPPLGVKLAFRLQKVEQIEDKTVTLEYNRQSAEQRSFNPPGFLRLLAEDLDGPPYFIEVDLDSPFFRELKIEVEAPPVFDPIGLMKADVAIEYGSPADFAGVKHADLTFRPTGSRIEKAAFFLNPKRELSYNLGLQYHFSPLAGWDGEKLSYELPTVSSLDRTLLVNPFRDFGFFEIKVVPGDLDPDMIDSTDVQLHYEHPGHWTRDKIITVRPGGPQQSWKLRLTDPQQQTFTYKWTHRLKDGTTRETQPVTTSLPLITVNDPFEEPLIIEFFPNFDTTSLRLLIVDITFTDPAFPKPRVQQIRFQTGETGSKRVRFARTDPSVSAFSIQPTILGNDNSVRRLPPVRLEQTVVFLGEHLGLEVFSRSW